MHQWWSSQYSENMETTRQTGVTCYIMPRCAGQGCVLVDLRGEDRLYESVLFLSLLCCVCFAFTHYALAVDPMWHRCRSVMGFATTWELLIGRILDILIMAILRDQWLLLLDQDLLSCCWFCCCAVSLLVLGVDFYGCCHCFWWCCSQCFVLVDSVYLQGVSSCPLLPWDHSPTMLDYTTNNKNSRHRHSFRRRFHCPPNYPQQLQQPPYHCCHHHNNSNNKVTPPWIASHNSWHQQEQQQRQQQKTKSDIQ